MVRVWRIVAAVVVVCLVLQPGCGGPDGSPSIPETTVVLDETTLDHLSYVSEDFSTLIFEHSTEQLSSLAAGDVIVCGVSEATPYGLLRRVTSVDVGDEQTTVETAFATLEDAIEECDVSGTWSLLPDGSAVPLGAVATATCTGWYIDIDDIVMAEAGSVRVVARGSICADIDLDFRLKIKSWNLREAHFSLTTAETAELEIAIEGAIEVLDGKWELYRQYMNPIVLWVGLMPVVITPVLTFNVGVDAKVYHRVTTSITQEAEVTVGVSYIQGTWSPVTGHSAAFGWDAPSLSTGCSVKGYVGPQLSLLLYGITGPYGEIRGYGKLEADILANPWWSLYGGVEARVGARIEILGRDIADYEVPAAIGYRVLLAQAETDTPISLIISSTAGGSVTTPGEGTFSYDPGTVVELEAGAAEGYQFVNWTGDVGTVGNVNAASTTITMNGDYTIVANFEEEEVEEAVYFPDPNLEAAIREAIDKPTGEVYPSDLEGLTLLDASYRDISDLTGLEHCTSLTQLYLYQNQISDISPLAGLNNLAELSLWENQISDISPLVDNTGLGEGDWVDLTGNPLSEQSINEYIPALEARGVQVYY